MSDDKQLTPHELEIMRVLWEYGEADIPAIHAQVGGDRAYTTVATLVKILEQKGFLSSRKEGRRLVYTPLTHKDSYERFSLRSLIAQVFGGNTGAFARRLVAETSPEELAELKKLLDGQEKP